MSSPISTERCSASRILPYAEAGWQCHAPGQLSGAGIEQQASDVPVRGQCRCRGGELRGPPRRKSALGMHNPPHSGGIVKRQCLGRLGLTVTRAAERPNVARQVDFNSACDWPSGAGDLVDRHLRSAGAVNRLESRFDTVMVGNHGRDDLNHACGRNSRWPGAVTDWRPRAGPAGHASRHEGPTVPDAARRPALARRPPPR